jgi:hypothetical protein
MAIILSIEFIQVDKIEYRDCYHHGFAFEKCEECKHSILVNELLYYVLCNYKFIYPESTCNILDYDTRLNKYCCKFYDKNKYESR